MNTQARFLIIAGVLAIVAGLLMLKGFNLNFFGKLPGDFTMKRANFTISFPLATCLILSLLLSLIMYFARK